MKIINKIKYLFFKYIWCPLVGHKIKKFPLQAFNTVEVINKLLRKQKIAAGYLNRKPNDKILYHCSRCGCWEISH